ncbi:MAG TPA: TPM domain-containing protein [Acidimicrobiia bacterium]|nr:TPM domain-containing protein [Acidimicrobiia bacterium]
MVRAARAVLFGFGLVLLLASPAVGQTYPPSTDSWVYDFAGAISASDETEITDLFKTLESETAIDAVAVAINSVSDYQPGVSLEEFAKGLFNHWQLGDVGIDDGVLLVVAVRDRTARVTIGDGFDDSFVAEAQAVIDSMLPSFRDSDYSGGIKTGAREIASRFRSLDGSTGHDPSDSAGSPSGGGRADMFEEVADEESRDGGGIPSGVWYAVGGGAALFGAGGFVTWQRIRPRKCPACASRTLSTSRRTIRMATEDHGRIDRIIKDCARCGYHHEQEVETPKKTRPSSRWGFRSGSSSGRNTRPG